ncbi:MAG: nitrile hydratase accessory protein [Gammaproteobacteria bacterium]|nr:nitrile hydratase accessory protein [Gammaproteobacteria bacterium]
MTTGALTAHTAFDTDVPAFDEPWQAEAFALAVELHRKGVFSWTEWSAALGSEIARSAERGEDDYFGCWLNAVEALVTRKGVASTEQLTSLAGAWREAYATTPHGQPVRLRRSASSTPDGLSDTEDT